MGSEAASSTEPFVRPRSSEHAGARQVAKAQGGEEHRARRQPHSPIMSTAHGPLNAGARGGPSPRAHRASRHWAAKTPTAARIHWPPNRGCAGFRAACRGPAGRHRLHGLFQFRLIHHDSLFAKTLWHRSGAFEREGTGSYSRLLSALFTRYSSLDTRSRRTTFTSLFFWACSTPGESPATVGVSKSLRRGSSA